MKRAMNPAASSEVVAESSAAKGTWVTGFLHPKGNSHNIRDILFDLGNVLAPFDWEIALRRLAPYLPADRARLLAEDKEGFKALFHAPTVALETGKIGFERFQSMMEKLLGARILPEEFHTLWCDIFRIDEAMVALGRFLSTHYRTWLVSNTSEAHYRWITAKFPRIAFYRGAALSYELGVMKPCIDFYNKVIERFDIDPGAAVFIDDLSENVEAAVRAGMYGIVFQGAEPLLRQLSELGVKAPSRSEVDH